MSSMARILVIGGSGRTGQLIVQKLQKCGDKVRVLSRHSKNTRKTSHEIEIVEGDITQLQDVQTAMQNIEGVIIAVESADSDAAPNSPEQVHYHGIRHVLAAAGDRPIPIILVTQIYITRPNRYPEMSHIIHWRQKAEQALRSSGLPYAIVRPGWLTDDAGSQGIRLEQGDTGEGEVARATVAEVCVQALHQPAAQGKTFEVYSDAGITPTDWYTVFAALHSDAIVQAR